MTIVTVFYIAPYIKTSSHLLFFHQPQAEFSAEQRALYGRIFNTILVQKPIGLGVQISCQNICLFSISGIATSSSDAVPLQTGLASLTSIK